MLPASSPAGTGLAVFRQRHPSIAQTSLQAVGGITVLKATVSSSATFAGIPNGTYTDAVTGDVKTVTDGSLTSSVASKGDMRIYVLSTTVTPAPGKVGADGPYLR